MKLSWLREVGFFIIKACFYVFVFIQMTSAFFPKMYEQPKVSIEDPRYAAYYDDGELPPCDVACVKQMIKDTLNEYGYPDQRRSQ